MRARATDHFSAHGQRISQSEIPHREALRCRSMLLRHDAPAFVNATSPQGIRIPFAKHAIFPCERCRPLPYTAVRLH